MSNQTVGRDHGKICPVWSSYDLVGSTAHGSWEGKIITRRYKLPVKALGELGRILPIPEAEKDAVTLVDFPKASDTKFLAVFKTELHHRIEFNTKASLGHNELDQVRTHQDRREWFYAEAWHS